MKATLSDGKLISALHAWPLAEPLAVRSLPGGLTSEVWDVQSETGHFIAKYSYQPEADFVNGLYAAALVERYGFTTGAPLRTREGKIAILVENAQGQKQPLALLRFVPGERVKPSEPDAAVLYGHCLGRIHSILLRETNWQCAAHLYGFLLQEDAYVTAQPDIYSLIQRTVQTVRNYENQQKVTYGVIWGDGMEIRRDRETGHVGIVDWGTVVRGPLLFDVALAVLWLFPAGTEANEAFLQSYLGKAPISLSELEGIDYYKALLWARQAKYYMYRVTDSVTLGGVTLEENKKLLGVACRELQYLLRSL